MVTQNNTESSNTVLEVPWERYYTHFSKRGRGVFILFDKGGKKVFAQPTKGRGGCIGKVQKGMIKGGNTLGVQT